MSKNRHEHRAAINKKKENCQVFPCKIQTPNLDPNKMRVAKNVQMYSAQKHTVRMQEPRWYLNPNTFGVCSSSTLSVTPASLDVIDRNFVDTMPLSFGDSLSSKVSSPALISFSSLSRLIEFDSRYS